MTRNEFKQVIKIMSFWKIDKRRGNYKLPNGNRLSDYLERFTLDFLRRSLKAIAKDGTVQDWLSPDTIFYPFRDNEPLDWTEQAERVRALVAEMVS